MNLFSTEIFKLKTLNSARLCVSLFLVCLSSSAQPHRAWLERYDGGNLGRAKEPVAMELDSKGNIYVVGQAGNASNLFNYVALKYSPNGKLLWSRQFGDTNGLNNIPRSIGVNTNDDLFITGTSVTVKYSSMGEALWTAPYGGTSLAVQSTNVYVTGFSDTQFSNVKLDGNGKQAWLRTFAYHEGPDTARRVVVDLDGNVLIAGQVEAFISGMQLTHMELVLLKYNPNGTLISTNIIPGTLTPPRFDPIFLLLKSDRSLFISYGYGYQPFNVYNLDSNGGVLWKFGPALSGVESSIDIVGSNIAIGSFSSRSEREAPGLYFGYFLVDKDGSFNRYVKYPAGLNVPGGSAFDLRAYSKTNVLLCGWTPGVLGTDDATILMADGAGNILWTDQYDGPSKAFDQFSKMVVDSQNNIYVTGFSENNQGGAEIFLMKYSQTSIEKKLSGSMILQFPGEPGKQLKVEATPTLVLPDWTQIGLGQVPANGLFQVEDTNANLFPSRFYRSVKTP